MKGNGNVLFFDEKDAHYLLSYMTYTLKGRGEGADVRYRAWQSTICQECDQIPTPDGFPHVLDEDGFVLICCEGYHQVNPNVLGIESENWHDWHEEMGGLMDDAPIPSEMEHLAIKCIGCGITRAVCEIEHAGKCCETCIHAEKP